MKFRFQTAIFDGVPVIVMSGYLYENDLSLSRNVRIREAGTIFSTVTVESALSDIREVEVEIEVNG